MHAIWIICPLIKKNYKNVVRIEPPLAELSGSVHA